MKPHTYRAVPPVARINLGDKPRLSEAFGHGNGQTPEISAAPSESAYSFPVQSGIDGALVFQPPGSLIVPSTLVNGQTPGYAAMWAPDADCPLAVVFRASAGGQKISSKPLIVLPGQILRPHGLTKEMGRGGFAGYDLGLPYGWLGGGVGRLLVFKTPDSHIGQASAEPREVLFHSTQLTIGQDFTHIPNWPQNPLTKSSGGTGGGDATHASQDWNAVPWVLTGAPQWVGAQGVPVPNWPSRFPWPNAFGTDASSGRTKLAMGGTASGDEGGLPRLSVRCTRVVLSLQDVNLPAANEGSVTAYVVPPSTLAVPDTGVLRTAPQVQFLTFNAADPNGFSTIEVTNGPLVTMGGDDAAVGLASGDASLQGKVVSVFRYGVLG